MNDDDFIDIYEACIEAGGKQRPVHPSTLWRWIKAKRISPPLAIGPNTKRFRRGTLKAELMAAATIEAA